MAFAKWVRAIGGYAESMEMQFRRVIIEAIFKNIDTSSGDDRILEAMFNVTSYGGANVVKDMFNVTAYDSDRVKTFLLAIIPDILLNSEKDVDRLTEMVGNAKYQWFSKVTTAQKKEVLDLVTRLFNYSMIFHVESMNFIRFRVTHIANQSALAQYSPTITEFNHLWDSSSDFLSYQIMDPSRDSEFAPYMAFNTVLVRMFIWSSRLGYGDIMELPVPMFFVGGSICAQCDNPAILRCSKCKNVKYCSPGCQAKDWNAGQHKLICVVTEE